ncbi:MAG: ATP-binding protein [Candidatus Marinimicrobia bacterium]|nr:ATP-binding protein [Candidatus Neomarinimicrobiota bacterium]
MVERIEVYEKIAPYIDKPIIKVISGIRRCGKSTFMKLLIKSFVDKGVQENNILYINKELLEFEFIKDYSGLNLYVKEKLSGNSEKKYLFIDEIQEIKDWEKAINSFLAEGIIDIYITGSNSRMLSSELATFLTGRYVLISMYPLSFKEFLIFRGEKGSLIEEEFQLYLKFGGLPGIHDLPLVDEVIFQYINSIYNTILLKDIVARYAIRDVNLFERIASFVFDNIGNITSAKRISDYIKSQNIKVSVDTVQNYMSFLKDAFIMFKAQRYDIKGKKHLEIYEKYYASDSGIRHSVLGYRYDDISMLLENIVYLELLRRGYRVTIGKLDNYEVDFIAQKNDEKIYFQVTYLLSGVDTVEREFRPLLKINDNYQKIVLSMDKIWGGDKDGIKRINIIEFLLNPLRKF